MKQEGGPALLPELLASSEASCITQLRSTASHWGWDSAWSHILAWVLPTSQSSFPHSFPPFSWQHFFNESLAKESLSQCPLGTCCAGPFVCALLHVLHLLHIFYYTCYAFYMDCFTYDIPFIYTLYLICTAILGRTEVQRFSFTWQYHRTNWW